jgi:hypothetical protein
VNNANVKPPLFTATSGTLVITAHNKSTKVINGTFNFNSDNGAASELEVTNGSFNMTY